MRKIRSAIAVALAALTLALMMISFSGEAEANECQAAVNTIVDGTSVTLNWSIKNGCAASNYRVLRRNLDDPDSLIRRIGEVDSTIFSYTDSGLEPNTTYRYRIRSSGLNMVSAATDVTTGGAPDAPTAILIPPAPTPAPEPESARSHSDPSLTCGIDEHNPPTVGFKTDTSSAVEGDSGKQSGSIVFVLSAAQDCDVLVTVDVKSSVTVKRSTEPPVDVDLPVTEHTRIFLYVENGTDVEIEYITDVLVVNIPAGRTEFPYTFGVFGDTFPEPDEEIYFKIIGTSVSGSVENVTIGAADHTATIENDDSIVVGFSNASETVGEGAGFTLVIPTPLTSYMKANDAGTLDKYVEYGDGLSMNLVATYGNGADESDWDAWEPGIYFPNPSPSLSYDFRTAFDEKLESSERITFSLEAPTSSRFIRFSGETVTITIEDNTVEVSNLTVGFVPDFLTTQIMNEPASDNCDRARISPYDHLGYELFPSGVNKPPVWAIISLYEGCSIDVTAVISATPGFPVQMRLAKSGDVNAVRGLPTAFTFDSSNTAETFTVTANQVSSDKTVRLHLTSREGLESFLEGLVIEVIDVE